MILPVPHTSDACAGAATGYLLRKIAYRAGAYAPGIQDFMFHELNQASAGRSLNAVSDWMGAHGDQLHALGYRFSGRRVMGQKTDTIIDWVKEGKGYRGAVLETGYLLLHPTEAADFSHAVGIAFDRVDAKSAEDILMIDPWPGVTMQGADRVKESPALEAAHREKNFHALVYFWVGWS